MWIKYGVFLGTKELILLHLPYEYQTTHRTPSDFHGSDARHVSDTGIKGRWEEERNWRVVVGGG
jgi:hypothetical protein